MKILPEFLEQLNGPGATSLEITAAQAIEALLVENSGLKDERDFWKRRADQRQIDINELKRNPASV
jgi:hypothetical protein